MDLYYSDHRGLIRSQIDLVNPVSSQPNPCDLSVLTYRMTAAEISDAQG